MRKIFFITIVLFSLGAFASGHSVSVGENTDAAKCLNTVQTNLEVDAEGNQDIKPPTEDSNTTDQ